MLLLAADRHGADGREADVPVPALQDRRLPARCEGAADDWGQHEPALVEEHKVSPASPRPSDDLEQLLTPLGGDGRLIAFLGLAWCRQAGPFDTDLRILRTWSGW